MDTSYEIRQAGTDFWFSITNERSDSTCLDTDYYLDLNGNKCSAYTLDNGNTPGTFDCSGATDGTAGFNAATQCCFCGGGDGSRTVDYDFNDFASYGSSDELEILYTTQAEFNPAKTFEVKVIHEISNRNLKIAGARAETTFMLTLADACLYNKITCDMLAIDLTRTISNNPSATTDTTSASAGCTQAVTFTDYNVLANTETTEDSAAFCTVTSTLELYYDSTDSWVTYDGSAPSTTYFPFISAVDTTNTARVVTIDTIDDTAYLRPVTYRARWKAEDADSIQPEGVVYDEFDITIQYGCTEDTVTLTNSGNGRDTPFVYSIGDISGTSNVLAKTTTHGHANTDCPISMDCQYWDSDAGAWLTLTDPPMKTCTMAGGLVFELEASDICVDVAGTDGNGYSCSDYTANYGSAGYECSNTNGGFSASSDCCICGGGTVDAALASYRPEKELEMRIVYNSTSSNLADNHGRVAID